MRLEKGEINVKILFCYFIGYLKPHLGGKARVNCRRNHLTEGTGKVLF